MKIKVWIAEDHTAFRQMFLFLINNYCKDIRAEYGAENGKVLLEKLAKQPKSKLPDVIVLDVQMPEMDGMKCAAVISQKYPSVKMIALSLFDNSHYVAEMFKNGAMGYFLKAYDIYEFPEAILAVAKGEKWLDSQISNILVERLKKEKLRKSVLNELELKILWYVSEGLTDKEISEKTFRSHRTIEQYRSALVKKLEARNTAMMIKKAAHEGLI